MTDLYPLTFYPIYKEKIWGGNKIRTILDKDFGDLANCGESWEISGVDGNITHVSQGNLKDEPLDKLIRHYQGRLIGESVYRKYGNDFPLLIKFIDADDDLSIQVHPDDILAKKLHNSFGKTEMWYIIHADPGSNLISGFNQPLDKSTYLNYFNEGKIKEILNVEKVKKGDVFFLPAGRIHTIGKGLLLAEIQQTSDITYRIYDFDRIDENGVKRELHIDQALEALDFSHHNEYRTRYSSGLNKIEPIVKCPYFQTNVLNFNTFYNRDYSEIDSFVILIGLEGSLKVEYEDQSYNLKMGQTMLIPASINMLKLIPDKEFRVLETFVP